MNTLPKHWSYDEVVPIGHVHEANNAYLASISTSKTSSQLPGFQPWMIEFGEEGPPKVAGRVLPVPVYATICDGYLVMEEMIRSGKYVFRGHSNCGWGFLPTKRRIKTQRARDFYQSCENRFSFSIRQSAYKTNVLLELEAMCQHYGILTNLLDFTELFEVAAYFAQAEHATEGIGCIWAFERAVLEKTGRFIHHSQIPGTGSNQRIVRQGGCFMRVDTEEVAEQLLELGTPILFDQLTKGRQYFSVREWRLSESYLFPHDFSDPVASLAAEIVAECKSMRSTVFAWECCNRQFSHERELFTKQFAANGLPEERRRWICRSQNIAIPNRLFCFEELAWAGDLIGIQEFFSFVGAFAEEAASELVIEEEWCALLLETVIRKTSSLRQLPVREAQAYWKIISHLAQFYGTDTLSRILDLTEDPASAFFARKFCNERRNLAEVVAKYLSPFPLGLDEAKHLRMWYWAETDFKAQTNIRRILDEYHESEWNREGVLDDWPPALPRLPLVTEKWAFRSNVMVWDVDVSPDGERIAAASSDCNVYFFDTNGTIRGRCEMPSEVRKARFVNNELLLANGRTGTLYGLKLTRTKERLDNCEIQFRSILGEVPNDVGGIITDFAISAERDCVFACYGNATLKRGGIARIDLSGKVVWNHRLPQAVLSIATNPCAKTKDNAAACAIATALNQDEKWVAFGVFGDGKRVPFVHEAGLLWIAGLTFDGDPMLSLTSDSKLFYLLAISWKGEKLWEIETEGISVSALSLQDGTVIAGATPVDKDAPRGRPSISGWRNSELMWRCPLDGQAFVFRAYPEIKLMLISTIGQGNICAISPNGSPMSCAKVEMAPLAFTFHPASNQVLVGSKKLTSFSFESFAKNTQNETVTDCFSCNSRGRCYICGGTGRLPSKAGPRIQDFDDFAGGNPFESESHKVTRLGPTCPVCYGKRDCVSCDGKGKLTMSEVASVSLNGPVTAFKSVLLGNEWKKFSARGNDESDFGKFLIEDTSVANRSAAISTIDFLGDRDVAEFRKAVHFIADRRDVDCGRYLSKRVHFESASRKEVMRSLLRLANCKLLEIKLITNARDSSVCLTRSRSEPGRLLAEVSRLLPKEHDTR